MKLASSKDEIATLKKKMEDAENDKRQLERETDALKDNLNTAQRQADDAARDRDRIRNSLEASGRYN